MRLCLHSFANVQLLLGLISGLPAYLTEARYRSCYSTHTGFLPANLQCLLPPTKIPFQGLSRLLHLPSFPLLLPSFPHTHSKVFHLSLLMQQPAKIFLFCSLLLLLLLLYYYYYYYINCFELSLTGCVTVCQWFDCSFPKDGRSSSLHPLLITGNV